MKTYFSTPILIAVLSFCIVAFVLVQNARADQGNMHRALDELRAARASLQEARGAKGGHRQAALDAVNRAIEETRAGIAVGEENE